MTWDTIPLKRIAALAAGGTPSVDETAYWADEDEGYPWVAISDMSSVDTVASTSRRINSAGLQAARIALGNPGTILFSMYASLGHTAWIDAPSAWNQAILGLTADPRTDARFLRYSLISIRPQLLEQSRSNTQANLNAEVVGNLRLPQPPLEEQRRIANFLDFETARIDHLTSLRTAQAKRLDERERAWRSYTFEQSRSGLPMRVKHLLRAKPRYGVLVPEFADEGVPYIRVNAISGLRTIDALPKIPESLSRKYTRTVTELGDVLLSVVGTMGRTAVITEPLVGANVARAVAVIRLALHHSPALFTAWVETAEFEQQAQLATGADSAQPTLGMEDLANFSLRWPADRAEEAQMAKTVIERRLVLESARSVLDRQLSLLAERRQALITAAVTGAITV